MSAKILRGRVFWFVSEPEGPNDHASYHYHADGAVVVEDGLIVASGPYSDVLKLVAPGAEVIDHRPHLILPGLIDTHVHYPQMQVIGSYAKDLLEWLNSYTFVEEQRFADPAHARRISGLFLDELVRQGTTSAAVYCTVHKGSADAFFTEAERRDMRMIAGKVMMDRNAPEALLDSPQRGYDETRALIERWDGVGRLNVAITPRFALTSTPAQLEAVAALVGEFPDAFIQTHVNESAGEIAAVAALFPDMPDYLGVYDHYRMLGPRTLLGHCIHMRPREMDMMAETGSVAVFCPTSNLFIGSGLFDRAAMLGKGIRMGIATDVGGGTSYSMLRTLDEGYKVLQLRGQRFSPLESWFMATLGNARALGLEDRIGTLEAGSEADIVVLDAGALPHMALKMERVETLAEELFLLQTCGDDRVVVETYVAGRAEKSRIARREVSV